MNHPQKRALAPVPRMNILALARSFPSLTDVPSEFFYIGHGDVRFTPDGAVDFAKWACVKGGGGRDAALFVLSVWNSTTDWREWLRRDDEALGGYFDVHRALGVWDPGHREAFLAWARDPWWM